MSTIFGIVFALGMFTATVLIDLFPSQPGAATCATLPSR